MPSSATPPSDQPPSRPPGASPSHTPGPALPADERPVDHTPVDTADLPDTPVRDRNIPATAWRQAPDALLTLGDDLPGSPEAMYKRRIGDWFLWRAGPASRGHARYLAIACDDLAATHSFRLFPDGDGEGTGPSGTAHTRFREWKKDLLAGGGKFPLSP